ncbi:unnamed protein product, partial [Adineta steineri]
MHSVCSSIFIRPEWIKGLYFLNASQYGVWDFRTTAYSQFELLSSFCSLSKEIISQTEIDIDNNELVTLYLLSEEQVQLQINGTTDLLKKSASSQLITYLDYLRNTTQTNYLVSALNTNLIIATAWSSESIRTYADQVSYSDPDTVKLCGREKTVADATLSQVNYELIDASRRHSMNPMPNSTTVNGFFTGCTPFEALLESTLDCLYQTECLQLLVDYFPIRQQMNFHANDSILTSRHENKSVNKYLNNLFIMNWSPEINYTKYFHQCSPSNCTYSKKDQTELSHGITLFISLYGGLIIILRLIASWSIDILSKIKCCSRERNENSDQNGKILKFIESMKRLNLFKNVNDRTETGIKQQKTITCVYLILLTGSICILCLFTSLNSETVTKIEKNPSLTTYNSLRGGLHSASIQCPCFKKAIPHQKFVLLSSHYHQICASGFVDNIWIDMLRGTTINIIYNDWRSRASPLFQLLSDFCQLANKTIDDAVKRYLSQLFIVSFVMNEDDFDKQLNTSLNQFFQSTIHNFDLMTNALQLLMQIDQLYIGANKRALGNLDTNLIGNFVEDKTNTTQLVKLKFILNQIKEINSSMTRCVCASDPYCKIPAVIYDLYYKQEANNNSLIYNISGWIRGCLAIDSLLLSTLQCLYEDSDCFPLLLSYIRKYENSGQPSLIIQPLVYNPMSRFSPNATVSTMFKEMMIEQWNRSSSYQSFYESCAPIYCTYSKKIRTENFGGVVIKLIATTGGIVALLRIVTPYLIKFIVRLLTICKKKKQHQPRERVHRSCIDRMGIMIRKLIKLLSTKLIELNVFSTRDFGSNTDQITAKRYGRWATRLYIILFLICLIILIFYTTIQPHSLTKTFDQPSFIRYTHLKKTYGNKLKCSCSKIASTYDRFVEIKPEF